MSENAATTVRLKVSPQVARIVGKEAPRDAQLSAARGALPLSGKDLLTTLLFLCNSKDGEIKRTAIQTLKSMPESILRPVIEDADLHPQLIDLVVRGRLSDEELMGSVIMNPTTLDSTLIMMARKATLSLLLRLEGNQQRIEGNRELVEAMIANPNTDRTLKFRLGWRDPDEPSADEKLNEVECIDEIDEEDLEDVDVSELMEDADEGDLSKYQIAMGLKVAEKIKMGLTGDKEWRNLLIKDSNKLVQAAVMKNPRITEGEVMMVAKNKTSNDELIRLILLNKDWIKNYEIKKALCSHPKTPVPKAIRFVPLLTDKDLKDLARSKQISTIISTAARKEMELRIKKRGG